MSDILTNTSRPNTDATLTVRIIKSLKFRTEKSLVIHHLDLTSTRVGDLKQIAKHSIATQQGWKPYQNLVLDTLKLYTKAHGSKTSNLIINLDHDDWILDDDTKLLQDVGFEHETEVSFFSRLEYDSFRSNPEV
ncbi:hypothetical protein CPB83DRAFT_866862 [Crepidotus variabilis]|uniref:Cytoplasmic protein n=1 Tax=Crepidotus variabilis TaxID=179855 RepID=A0A9P6ERG6_9AGAR|nr:hypothetical protein CPB83DRAFT_866862 [Crepidotus variabilis]